MNQSLHRHSLLVPLLVLFPLACGKSDGSAESGSPPASKAAQAPSTSDSGVTRIEELGVSAALPEGFSYEERGAGHWIRRSPSYGAELEKRGALPSSLDAAIASWMSGEVANKGELAGGGYWAVIETEFPTAEGEPLVLPHVYVQLPAKEGSVLCKGQLQPGDDAAPLLEACKTIEPL
jgi:hypothetical protein